MPSDEQNKPEEKGKVVEFKAAEGGEMTAEQKAARQKAIDMAFKKEKKHPLGLAWWLAIIVFILISISFVAAPAIEAFVGRRGGTGLEFGKYDGEPIEFKQGNYFFEQYQNYADRYRGSSSNPEQTAYAIWQNAYYSTVFYTALDQMARKAGIIAADPVVNRRIIESGYYDKDGKFDAATYQNASADRKQAIDTTVRRSVPTQMVLSDLSSVLSSSAEQDFVAAMADNTRAFEYASFDVTTYPDEEASKYAVENSKKFQTMGLSRITAPDQAAAQALLDKINGGEQFATVASESSTDGFKTEGGKVGDTVYFFQIQDMFKNQDEADQVLSAKVGQVVGPFESINGWMLLKLDSAVVAPDFTNQETLNGVKAYMSLYDSQMIDDYLKDQAQKFADKATAEGFDKALSDSGLTSVSVGQTPLNAGGSSFLGSFASTDPKQMMAQITDSETLKTLFTAEDGAVTGPVQAGTAGYLVVKSAEKGDTSIGDYLKQFYGYLTSNTVQADTQYTLLHSDKFQDNFLTVFLGTILGQDTQSK